MEGSEVEGRPLADGQLLVAGDLGREGEAEERRSREGVCWLGEKQRNRGKSLACLYNNCSVVLIPSWHTTLNRLNPNSSPFPTIHLIHVHAPLLF